ncbi:MAG: 4Fe-4S dicluster domain-containing protein [Bacteroidales bacterium]|nr:4Fe-4S dicluster domain-containing protein [Bacteroidales bacterium]
MKNFGYTIQRDQSIDIDQNDRRIVNYLLSLEPSFSLCLGCGSCTGTCTAGHFVDFNIRRVHTLLRRGESKQLKTEMKKCMFCGKCQLVCPRGVNLRNLIITIQRAIEQIG